MFFGFNEICRLKFRFFDNVSYLFFAALLFNKWCCKICGRAVAMDSLYFLHAVSESVRYSGVPTKTTRGSALRWRAIAYTRTSPTLVGGFRESWPLWPWPFIPNQNPCDICWVILKGTPQTSLVAIHWRFWKEMPFWCFSWFELSDLDLWPWINFNMALHTGVPSTNTYPDFKFVPLTV